MTVAMFTVILEFPQTYFPNFLSLQLQLFLVYLAIEILVNLQDSFRCDVNVDKDERKYALSLTLKCVHILVPKGVLHLDYRKSLIIFCSKACLHTEPANLLVKF